MPTQNIKVLPAKNKAAKPAASKSIEQCLQEATLKVEKKTLHIVLPLTDEPRESASGKSIIMGTTSGFKTVLGDDGVPYKVSLNVTV